MPLNRTRPWPDGDLPREDLSNGYAPDCLIRHLQEELEAEQADHPKAVEQFVKAGFTDDDLVLSPFHCPYLEPVQRHTPQELVDIFRGTTAASAQAPSIAERLLLCLDVLSLQPNVEPVVFLPGTHELAQRCLSTLLIESPVLAHPRIRVRLSQDSVTEPGAICSLIHAIALSATARLPSVTDWPEGEAPMEQLSAFSTSWVFRDALRTRSIMTPGAWSEVGNLTPVAACLKSRGFGHIHRHADMLARLYELGQLVPDPETRRPGPGIHLNDWADIVKADTYIHKQRVVADCFLESCGVTRMGAATVALADAHKSDSYMRFLASLPASETKNLRHEIGQTLMPLILFSGTGGLPTDTVRANVTNLIEGLVACGNARAPLEAAQWFQKELGSSVLSNTPTETALGVVRALHDHGIMLSERDLNTTWKDADLRLGGSLPAWLRAINIVETENTMARVINRVAPPAANGSEAGLQGRPRRGRAL